MENAIEKAGCSLWGSRLLKQMRDIGGSGPGDAEVDAGGHQRQ
jgi:hypothetical protein